jgi:FkbM family methyltransferase
MQVSWRKRMSRALRGRLRSNVLSKHGFGVIAATRNGVLVVDPRDFSVSRSLLQSGSYDWPEVCWLSRLIDADSRLVFVGAHLGALLIPIAQRSGARHIVAFEPSPNNHRLLKINLALNDLAAITVHHAAVGDREGEIGFTQNPINSGNSRVAAHGEVTVPVTTLDTALPATTAAIDLLVMDVEGFEVYAIRGGPNVLSRTRYFYVEYAPEQLEEQGSHPGEFIDLVARHFSSMYLQGETSQFFPAGSYVQYLRDLPPRRGLLLNLLFCNQASPEIMDTLDASATAGAPD